MKIFFFFAALLFVLRFANSELCGITGKDFHSLGYIWVNDIVVTENYWVFSSPDECTPTKDPGSAEFVKGTITYKYDCIIQNATALKTVAYLRTFSTSSFNDACRCDLPLTPEGLFLHGYLLTLRGVFEGAFNGTIRFYEPCEVWPIYENYPLQAGDTFSQVFRLYGKCNNWACT